MEEITVASHCCAPRVAPISRKASSSTSSTSSSDVLAALDALELEDKNINPSINNASETTFNAFEAKKGPVTPETGSKDALPTYSYKDYKPSPALVLTRHEEEANELISSLRGPLGFDMEWRVFFLHGRAPYHRRTALVQLCDKHIILLIQISALKRIPQGLKAVLESPEVYKIGVNILNDARKLHRDFGITCAGLIELGALARHVDIDFSSRFLSILGTHASPNRSIISLAKLVALYEGKRLDKGKERTSNWEAELDDAMKTYAANDVHSALTTYRTLKRLAKAEKRTLDLGAHALRLAGPDLESKREGEDSKPAPEPTPPARPQHVRAYRLWHEQRLPLREICARLRSAENPLKESTVITYVVEALRVDASLPFDMKNLKELVLMDVASWTRHYTSISAMEKEGRGTVLD